ncbi:MAG: hypothetical protein NTU91_13315 [Chloroflexi bacterium]|nr:hypothetical protein [Chloroflexota bacterium]
MPDQGLSLLGGARLMKHRRIEALLPFAVVAAFMLVILLFLPFRFKFEFDPDEGIQLIKAFLYTKGYALQTEIYSDQPPVFTVVLSTLFRIFGPEVLVARLAVLAFSCLLLTAGAHYLKLFHGQLHYLVALLFLITLPGYPELSVSAMIGLPSMSLAMVSVLALGVWHRRSGRGWLLLSALALALSTLTKAFSLILMPIFALAIVASVVKRGAEGRFSVRALWPAAAWLGVVISLQLVLLLALIGPTGWDQLIGVHLAAQDETFEARKAVEALRATWPMLLLALVGGWRSLVRRSWSGLVLTGWLILGLVALFVNQPAWWHQHILATIPAAMLAGITVADCLLYLRGRGKTLWPPDRRAALSLLGILVAVGYLAFRIPGHLEAYKAKLPNLVDDGELRVRDYEVLAAMAKADPEGGLIVTDRPMFAFRSEREIPPELAVFSRKMLSTGWLTEDEVIAAIRRYDPRVVLFGRFDLPKVRSFVQGQYELIYAYYPFRLYLRE